jgi:hypothetical protein
VSSATCAREAKLRANRITPDTGVVLQPVALLRSEFVPGNADLQHLVSFVEIQRPALVVAPLRVRARGQRQIVVALRIGRFGAEPGGPGERSSTPPSSISATTRPALSPRNSSISHRWPAWVT